jgi:hypothetical protein
MYHCAKPAAAAAACISTPPLEASAVAGAVGGGLKRRTKKSICFDKKSRVYCLYKEATESLSIIMQPTTTCSGSRNNSANDALRMATDAAADQSCAGTIARLIQADAAKDAENARLIQDNNAKDATIAAFAHVLQLANDTVAHERKMRCAATDRLNAGEEGEGKKVKALRKVISELQELKEKTREINFVKGQLANKKMDRKEAVASSKRYKRDAEALAAEIARRDQAAAL